MYVPGSATGQVAWFAGHGATPRSTVGAAGYRHVMAKKRTQSVPVGVTGGAGRERQLRSLEPVHYSGRRFIAVPFTCS